MINQTCKNGYKICKISKENQEIIKIFLSKSFFQAVKIKKSFTNQNKDTKVYWNIYPISKNEIKLGIWKETPFDSLSKFYFKEKKQ